MTTYIGRKFIVGEKLLIFTKCADGYGALSQYFNDIEKYINVEKYDREIRDRIAELKISAKCAETLDYLFNFIMSSNYDRFMSEYLYFLIIDNTFTPDKWSN